MKKKLYFPLLLTLLASLVFGVFPLGQPSTVYAAPDFQYKKPTAFTDTGTLWNLQGQAYDFLTPDDETTAADSSSNSDAYPWITFHTWGTKTAGLTYTATDLFVNWNTNGAYDNDTWGIQYTDDGGNNWTDLVPMGVHNDTAMVESTITFATNDQDLTLVQVKLNYERNTGGDSGATYIYDIWTRGTHVSPTVTNLPIEYGFGLVAENSTATTGLTYFEITNGSTFAIDIAIKGTDMANVVPRTWGLDDTGSPGTDIYALYAGLEGGSYDIIVRKTATYNTLTTDLAADGTQRWGLEIYMPTTINSPLECADMTATVTLICTAS